MLHFAVCLRSTIHRSGRRLLFQSASLSPSHRSSASTRSWRRRIAFLFRFNKIAIYTGTFINNPFLTLVPIIIASYAVGAFILGRPLRIPDEGLELLKNPRIFSGDYYRLLFVQSWSDVVWPFSVGAHGALGGLFAIGLSANITRVARLPESKKATDFHGVTQD